MARQPILDQEKNIFAYELLFRSANAKAAVIDDATKATAQVIVNTVNSIGIEKIVGKSLAFINCDRNMLLEGALHALDPNVFVIEVLEDVKIDENVLVAIKSLKEAGFKIALDDFVLNPDNLEHFQDIIPFTDFIKVDLTLNSPQQISEASKYLSHHKVVLLAEKVEYEEDFNYTSKHGFSLFQGYFFAKPEIIEGNSIDARAACILQLLNLIQKDPDIEELEEAFKQQPEITLNLLKFINSVNIGLRNEISSIRQALTLIGMQKLQQWLMIMTFAHDSQNARSALFLNASQRARTMELMAKEIPGNSKLSDQAFLTGMVSQMDALYKVELSKIISEISLEKEVEEALINRSGILGTLLCTSKELEQNQYEKAVKSAKKLNINEEQLQQILLEVWDWVESLAQQNG
ncbi:MAG: EAL domain-containing protein [Fibrobacter sp.]|nr:EAL domain-containing protein [Fibrobacter sp.]